MPSSPTRPVMWTFSWKMSTKVCIEQESVTWNQYLTIHVHACCFNITGNTRLSRRIGEKVRRDGGRAIEKNRETEFRTCICVTWRRGRTICMLVFDSKESILQSRRSRNHSSGWGWETAVQGIERREESAAHMLENTVSKVKFGIISYSTQIWERRAQSAQSSELHGTWKFEARTELNGKCKLNL